MNSIPSNAHDVYIHVAWVVGITIVALAIVVGCVFWQWLEKRK